MEFWRNYAVLIKGKMGLETFLAVIAIYLFSKYAADPYKGLMETINLKKYRYRHVGIYGRSTYLRFAWG